MTHELQLPQPHLFKRQRHVPTRPETNVCVYPEIVCLWSVEILNWFSRFSRQCFCLINSILHYLRLDPRHHYLHSTSCSWIKKLRHNTTSPFRLFLGKSFSEPYKHKNTNTIYLFISFSYRSLTVSSENDQTRLFTIRTKKFSRRKYAFSASKYHKR